MPKLNFNDTQYIHYQCIEGDNNKPHLVFLHEGLGCIEMWKGFPKLLCELSGCPGLIYDRIGYGKSSPLTTERTVNYLHDYALNELPQVIDNLIPNNQFILVGHSDGASIALIYGAKKNNKLMGIISEAAHVMVENETYQGVLQANKAWKTNKFTGLYKYHGDKTEQMFKAWANTWLQPWFQSWNIEPILSEIEVPILVLQGKNDQYASEAQVSSIDNHTKGLASCYMLKNTAHTPHFESKDKVLELMTNFITIITTERYLKEHNGK